MDEEEPGHRGIRGGATGSATRRPEAYIRNVAEDQGIRIPESEAAVFHTGGLSRVGR